jgi:6-phosphogluconolactonase
MPRTLARQDVPWLNVHVFQVDERIAPEGDADRNLTHLRESLLERAPLRPEQIYPPSVVSSVVAAGRVRPWYRASISSP